MNDVRCLTRSEARLLGHAAERWLRLRDVEPNLGEQALQLLGKRMVRSGPCDRTDMVRLAWTVCVLFPGAGVPLPLMWVQPQDADVAAGRFSLLSEVGLPLIDLAVGAIARVPLARGRLVRAKVLGTRPPAAISSGLKTFQGAF